MTKYQATVKVDQIVTKEIIVWVEAASQDEVEMKVRQALAEYPKPVSVEGITRMVTNKTDYWIPKSIEFDIKELGEASA